jgi:GT2 family glycosyltransferase
MRIAALLTCFNRKEKTLQCLRELSVQALPEGVVIETVLVDDGSRDGTAEAVIVEFPRARVIRGDGSLYWCGGMRKAWREAAASDPDHYLLLNDDTLLLPGALRALLEIAGTPDSRIIAVAAIRDPHTGKATYGGIRHKSGLVAASGKLETCDTFNANAVLVPRSVYRELGIFHETYTHGMGDFDYGYAATRRGIRVIQSAEFLGECERNALAGSWRDRSLSRATRWNILRSPKGLPFREWMTFNRRNAGWVWPIRTVSPYVKVLLGR